MNKKQLIVSILAILSTPYLAFATIETYQVDLDNNGKKEIITTEFQYKTGLESIITIYSFDKIKLDTFSMPEYFTNIEFVSLNKDGHKQIVAYSHGMYYLHLAIYGLKNKRLYKIFETGSISGCRLLLNEIPPKITVGRAGIDKGIWSFVRLNKDGHKQIVAQSNRGMQYPHLAIHDLKNNKLHLDGIYDTSAVSGIELLLNQSAPKLKKAWFDTYKSDWYEPDNWEVWVWDGKRFNEETR